MVAESALQLLAREDRTLYRPDELLLYAPKPHSRRLLARLPQNGGGSIEVAFNAHGFRGPELRRAPARRVAVYGDSFVQADGTALADTFVARLEKRLASRLGRAVEVVNAGVAGYGPDQEGLRMQRELPALSPDVLVLVVYAGNDFGDLLRNRIFRLGDDGELVFAPVPLAQPLREWLRRASDPTGVRSLQTVLRLERLREAARDAVLGFLAPRPPVDHVAESLRLAHEEYVDAVVDPKPEVSRLFDDRYDGDVALEPESDAARYKVALFAATISWLRGVAERARRPLVVLIVPSAVDACEDYDVKVDPGRYPRYERARLTDTVARVVGDAGLPFVNLHPAFREVECPYFHGNDNHWNEAGQELAARLLDEHLAATGALR